MPRLTAEREDAARRALLRAARDVFVAKGFQQATVDEVARAAQIAVGSIYTYFSSKDELIRASILDANQAEADAVLVGLEETGPVVVSMQRAVAGWYRYTIDAPGVAAFLAEVWAAAPRKPLIRDLVARRRDRVIGVASSVLRRAVANDLLPAATDVAARAGAIASLLDGVVVEAITTGEPPALVGVQARVLVLAGLDNSDSG